MIQNPTQDSKSNAGFKIQSNDEVHSISLALSPSLAPKRSSLICSRGAGAHGRARDPRATWHPRAAIWAAAAERGATAAAAVRGAVGGDDWEIRWSHETLNDVYDELNDTEKRWSHRGAILIGGDDLEDHLQDTENRIGRNHREKRWAEEKRVGLSQGLRRTV